MVGKVPRMLYSKCFSYTASLRRRLLPMTTLPTTTNRCIDFVFYYPAQPIPLGGLCGPGFCGGEFHGGEVLSEGSHFNRTFGIVEACEEDLSVRTFWYPDALGYPGCCGAPCHRCSRDVNYFLFTKKIIIAPGISIYIHRPLIPRNFGSVLC